MDTRSEELPFRMEPGERFAGKYLIQRVLGTGGMGVVVAARHEQLGLTVAIKLLSVHKDMQPEGIARFFREARAAAALRSEHAARVVDVDVDEAGRHYIVMEHLEGEDLAERSTRGEILPVSTSVGYILHACEAIAEAHSLGIVHRDLKPGNLFLSQRMDGSPIIKVLDFGISKIIETESDPDDAHPPQGSAEARPLSGNKALLGTPSYMSPEQIRTPREVDGRSDVWSLGVILYELLTGELPFTGSTVPDIIASIITVAPPAPTVLRSQIPEELSAVVLACLRKNPEQRTANVGLLAKGLRPWAPRWARDAAIRAARIAGVGSLTPESTSIFPPLASPQSTPARARVSLPVAEAPVVALAGETSPKLPRGYLRLLLFGIAVGMVVTVMIPIFTRARRRWGHHPSPESGTSGSVSVEETRKESRTVAPPIAPAPASVGAAPPPRVEAPPAVPETAPSVANAPVGATPEAPEPADEPRLSPSPPASGGSARDDGAPARTPAGGGPLDERGPVPATPKHPGPASAGSVIHMGPHASTDAPTDVRELNELNELKKKGVRPGAGANGSPPDSDPLGSRR
jgi:serine/threonine-protein kinase